jgi:hypothetical protein
MNIESIIYKILHNLLITRLLCKCLILNIPLWQAFSGLLGRIQWMMKYILGGYRAVAGPPLGTGGRAQN